jgi:diguanylate cyclase (GGDEF)-like protein/PAS domain S-box-containing protein
VRVPVAGNGPHDPLLALLDALPDAVIVTDAASPQRVRWASRTYLELTGARLDELCGRPLAESCSHDRSASAFERLLHAVEAGEAADGRLRICGRAGRLITLAVRVIQLPGDVAGDARAAWVARIDDERTVARIDEAIYSYALDAEGRAELVYTSPRFEALVDTSPASLAPIDAWRARIHPDDRAVVLESRARLLAGHPLEREYRLCCADGKERVVLDRANPSPPEDGIVTVDGILIDVTARRQAALAFAETSSRLAHMIESIDEYIYTDVAGIDGHLGSPLYASPGIFRTLGRSVPLERLNEEWEKAVHPDDRAMFMASHERMATGEAIEVEYRVLRPDGEARWVFDRARPRRTPDGRMLIDGVIADITERRRVADELAAARDEADRRSRVDALTGLFNRGHFTEALAAELDRAARAGATVGLLIADIDHFKRVNDTHGHLVGDRVLAEIADRLATAVRRYDTLARFGGEEFVVLVPDVRDLDALVGIGEQLRHAVRNHPFSAGGNELAITVSLGVALAHAGDSADALIGAADRALYAAKDAGRDCVRAATQPAAVSR